MMTKVNALQHNRTRCKQFFFD